MMTDEGRGLVLFLDSVIRRAYPVGPIHVLRICLHAIEATRRWQARGRS
jgi:hypothetical protein